MKKRIRTGPHTFSKWLHLLFGVAQARSWNSRVRSQKTQRQDQCSCSIPLIMSLVTGAAGPTVSGFTTQPPSSHSPTFPSTGLPTPCIAVSPPHSSTDSVYFEENHKVAVSHPGPSAAPSLAFLCLLYNSLLICSSSTPGLNNGILQGTVGKFSSLLFPNTSFLGNLHLFYGSPTAPSMYPQPKPYSKIQTDISNGLLNICT